MGGGRWEGVMGVEQPLHVWEDADQPSSRHHGHSLRRVRGRKGREEGGGRVGRWEGVMGVEQPLHVWGDADQPSSRHHGR